MQYVMREGKMAHIGSISVLLALATNTNGETVMVCRHQDVDVDVDVEGRGGGRGRGLRGGQKYPLKFSMRDIQSMLIL